MNLMEHIGSDCRQHYNQSNLGHPKGVIYFLIYIQFVFVNILHNPYNIQKNYNRNDVHNLVGYLKYFFLLIL